MFRLKHYFANLVINGNSAFKLHYVQIKTNCVTSAKSFVSNFKLHYVQIKTFKTRYELLLEKAFKLHYVQIKTRKITLFQ